MSDRTVTRFQRQAAEFIAALEQLDAGGLARLKRNAGHTLADARDVHRAFFQSLPYTVSEHLHEDYFLIATLFPLADNRAGAGNFGDTMRRVKQARGGDTSGRANSLDRRFETLLDCEREHLHFRLRQAVRLAASSQQAMIACSASAGGRASPARRSSAAFAGPSSSAALLPTAPSY